MKFLFVEGADQTAIEDGGWLLGLGHDLAADLTGLVVFDAARVPALAVVTVMILRQVPFGFHGLWVPIGAEYPPSSTKEHR